MVRNVAVVASIAAVVGLIAVGSADARGQANKKTFGCKTDRMRLCPQSAPDKAAPCLKKHMSELSPACRAKTQGK
jgi:hypothetical protein